MKVSRFTIPIYGYTVIYIKSDDQIGEDVMVKRALKEVKAKDDQIVDTIRRMNDRMGGGEHYYNPDLLKSVIVIFSSKSKKQKICTIAHEKRHLEDAILETLGIKDREAAGYLAGYLAEKLR